MPHGRSLRYSSFNANDLLTYPFGFLSSLSNRSTHRGQTESNSSQQPNQHGDESDVYKDETGGRLAQASDFLNFLGSEPVAESSLASDSRREMIIKATTNIYDTQNISWPNSIVSNFVAKLALANELLSISSCPCLYGGQKLVALKSGSLLASLARNWGFSPSSIALGSTYFQRLVTVQGEGQIGQWVQASTDFRPYLSIVKSSKGRDKNELGPGIREKAVRACSTDPHASTDLLTDHVRSSASAVCSSAVSFLPPRFTENQLDHKDNCIVVSSPKSMGR